MEYLLRKLSGIELNRGVEEGREGGRKKGKERERERERINFGKYC